LSYPRESAVCCFLPPAIPNIAQSIQVDPQRLPLLLGDGGVLHHEVDIVDNPLDPLASAVPFPGRRLLAKLLQILQSRVELLPLSAVQIVAMDAGSGFS